VLAIPGCIPESQCGFLPGRSTVDAILVSRLLASNALERDIKLFKCFIDLTKAYDRVDRDTLWIVLERYGVPPKLLTVIKNLHVGAFAKVKIKSATGEDIFSEALELLRGLKQGSVFAPLLFNIFFGAIIQAFHRECEKSTIALGVNFGYDLCKNTLDCFSANRNTKYIRLLEILFADDCELFAESEQALQIMVEIFDRVCSAFAQELSIKKTQVMVVERLSNNRTKTVPSIKVRGVVLVVVESFVYLGSRESNEGDMTIEVGIRKQRMIAAFSLWSGRILMNRNISLRLRLIFFTMIVIPNGVYGCSTWNLSAADIKTLDAVQFRLLKKLLLVPKIQRISYETVLSRCKKAGCNIVPIECKILRLQLRYLGHIERMGSNRFQRIIVHGGISSGKRKQGQPPKSFRHAAQYALENFGLLHQDWRTLAQDRVAWRLRVNKSGNDFFVQKWLEKRAAAKAIRHALILGNNIAAHKRAVLLKNYYGTHRKNRNRDRFRNNKKTQSSGGLVPM
jgi:hypothetical protein